MTVTDPAARRYFLTIDEAVDLLLLAAAEPQKPALFAHLRVGPRLHAEPFCACAEFAGSA